MRIFSFSRTAGLLFALALAASFASAQEPAALVTPDPGRSELRLKADRSSYNETTDTFTAEGSVRVIFGDISVETDKVFVNRASSTVTVPGELTFTRDGESFMGNNLTFDYSNASGRLEQACGCRQGVNIKGETLEFSKEKLLFRNAVFTTCTLDKMDYHIAADTVELFPDRRMTFKKIGFYLWNRRLLKWGSFSMKGEGQDGGAQAGPGQQVESGKKLGGFHLRPPAAGYSDLGGLHIRTGVYKQVTQATTLNLRTSYYFSEGFFPEIEASRNAGGPTRQWVRYGKQFKENTGYFRYAGPVSVSNLPTAGVDFGNRISPNGRLRYHLSTEAGRMKEKQNTKPYSRAFARLYMRYPLNPKQRVTFSLVSEGRYAVYTGWRKYRVFGNGLAMETPVTRRSGLSLEYLKFSDKGRTPFYSDLVNTNDRLFGLLTAKLTKRTSAHIDAEYDLDNDTFNEVEYGLTRKYNCIRVDAGWRKELKSVYFRLNVLGLDSGKGKTENRKN